MATGFPASNPFGQFLRKLPPPFRNKYFLAMAAFFFILVFIDRHNLLTQFKLNKSLRRLEDDKVYFEKKIEEAKLDRQNVENNKEQFAREKYHMHKNNEEVFIIPDKKED